MANGGIIGVVNTPTQQAASGVWTLEEHFLARLADIWPTTIEEFLSSGEVWLDASDTSTITESGGDVSQWNNKGTLGNFAQATGALQPKTGVTTLNSLNVLDFNQDFLTSADAASSYKFFHDGTKVLFAVVGKSGTSAGHGAAYNVFSTNPTYGPSAIGAGMWYDDRGGASGDEGFQNFVGNGGGAYVTVNTANNTAPTNTFSIVTVLTDYSNATAADRSAVFGDDGTAVKNNTLTNAVSSSDPAATAGIGGHSTDGSFFRLVGSIAELIVISGADATETNRIRIRDYLNTKWAVY